MNHGARLCDCGLPRVRSHDHAATCPWAPRPTTSTADLGCPLCGGNVGQGRDGGTHELCKARRNAGLPTPSLGKRCSACDGLGFRAPAAPGTRAGVMLDLALGPTAIARSIRAQFPRCQRCAGSGVEPVERWALDCPRCGPSTFPGVGDGERPDYCCLKCERGDGVTLATEPER